MSRMDLFSLPLARRAGQQECKLGPGKKNWDPWFSPSSPDPHEIGTLQKAAPCPLGPAHTLAQDPEEQKEVRRSRMLEGQHVLASRHLGIIHAQKSM